MNNKKTITYLIIFVVFMIVIIGGATFAFFASTQDVNANLPANITTAAKTYTFIASADGEINFYLSAQDMSEDNVNENYIMADNGLINVEVASANDGEITKCTYDIAWVWDSDNKYTTPDAELPYEKDGITYPYELSVSVDGGEEKELSTFTLDSNNSFIIATGLQSMATNTTPVIGSHKIEVKAYNIPIDQQNLFNKSFQAHMEVKNVNCDVVNGTIASTFFSEKSGEIINLEDNGETYTGAIVNENGLRFEGKNPNNYVQFNDELWRIIGVFDENTHGRSGEQLVKLIRAEALPGYYQWDNKGIAGSNNWNDSLLKTNLNTNYYNNKTLNACSNYDSPTNVCTTVMVSNEGIKSDIARNMIQPIQWKIGGINTIDLLISEIYLLERSEKIPKSEGATAISNELLPIGLMYPSDYGYAVLADNCSRNVKLYNYDTTELCHMKNWLFNSYNAKYKLTLTPLSSNDDSAFTIQPSGNVNNRGTATALLTYPVLYLNQKVTITGGLGTKLNPYTIA